MKRLDFDFPSNEWRSFSDTEFKDILRYADGCESLEEMTFSYSLLPFEFGDIKGISRKTVKWIAITLGISLELNYVTGKWEKFDGTELREDEYNKIEKDAKCSADDTG